ncbi:HEPN domain-containing protein [soil metagenome]
MAKTEYINYRISKSNEAFEDAELLAKNQRWNSCVNRLYYSSFYLLTALLYRHQIKANTHNGTKTAFFLYFVKENKISKDLGKLYSTLFDWRQQSDYTDFTDFDEDTVKPLMRNVAELNGKLKQLLSGE